MVSQFTPFFSRPYNFKKISPVNIGIWVEWVPWLFLARPLSSHERGDRIIEAFQCQSRCIISVTSNSFEKENEISNEDIGNVLGHALVPEAYRPTFGSDLVPYSDVRVPYENVLGHALVPLGVVSCVINALNQQTHVRLKTNRRR